MPLAEIKGIKLDMKRLDEIARKLDTNRENALKRIAFQVEAHIKKYIQQKHIIDTGAYFNSILAEPINPELWWVHDGVDYGIWQEFGHHNVAPRTAFTPAVEDTRRDVNKIMGEELFK